MTLSRWLRKLGTRQPRRSRPGRSRPQLGVEALEERSLLTGTWAPLTNLAPSVLGTMMLLSDGTVMAQGAGVTNAWYKLTPDASGGYANGTWSARAPMGTSRLYFGSNVLPSGQVLVLGGEYTSAGLAWTNTGEMYDPATNTWSPLPSFPQPNFGDDPTVLLPSGKVLAGYLGGPQTYLYDPAAATWLPTGNKLRQDPSDEESWTLLPDGSVLSYDIFGPSTPPSTAQRYNSATGTWVDAGSVPVSLTDPFTHGSELGPGSLLPDGRVFLVGANGSTALYTPSSNSWVAGPTVPNAKGSDDAPGALLPDGHVMFAADTPLFNGPTQLFDFDPAANTITQITTLPAQLSSDLTGPSFIDRMLVLPTGQLLLTTGNTSRLWLYTPDGVPSDAWRPTVSGVASTGGGTFTLTGTQLTGISEGASYGDDAEMSTNYPIVQLTDSAGHAWYARTFNWTPGVATGTTPTTAQFTLPAGMPDGVYSLRVIANGIASLPVNINTFPGLAVLNTTPANGTVVTTRPNSFVVNFNEAVQSATFLPGALTVNGIAADKVTLNAAGTSATFTFNNSPVTAQGVQSLALAAGSGTGQDGTALLPFSASFRYDATTLTVTSTAPSAGGVFTIPAGSFTYDVTFNEPIDPATAGTDDVALSQGTVTGATVLAGNRTVRYTLSGITAEGTLSVNVAAGKVKDQFDNPGFAPFAAAYPVDVGTAAYASPLTAVPTQGSLVYDSTPAPGTINFGNDTDTFTLNLDPGQTITALVIPIADALRPSVQVLDPSGAVLGSVTAGQPDQAALLQTLPVATGGTYRIVVGGASTVGDYTLEVTLNAAVEAERFLAVGGNDVTAQNLDPAFQSVRTGTALAQRGAVLGWADFFGGPDYYSFSATAGQTATLALTGRAAGNLTLDLIAPDGFTVLASGVAGSANLGASVSHFTFAAAGTYFARVTGDANVPYNLVVTRDAAFDTEPNDGPAAAQDVTGLHGALGALTGTGVGFQAHAVAPGFVDISATGTPLFGLTNADDASVFANIGFTFNFFGTDYTSLFVSSNGLITFASPDVNFFNGPLNTSLPEAAIAPFWDDLLIRNSTGTAAVKTQVLGAPGRRQLVIQWDKVSFFPGTTTGDTLTFEAVLSEGSNNIQFNYLDLVSGTAIGNNGASATVGVKAAGIGGQFLALATNSGPNAFVGTGKSTLITRATPEDWYRVTLAADQTALQVDTATPAGGAGQFANALDPHVQLFDAANTLVATGSPLADGRNESLRATGLTPGATYYVRVTADNNRGEYFLGVTPLRTPTITSAVDDGPSGSAGPDGSFTVPTDSGKGWTNILSADAYQGDYTVHAQNANPSGGNYASWTIRATSANPELFATWVALPGNATNATYQVFLVPSSPTAVVDDHPLLTVVVDQTRLPGDALLFGTTLAESLGWVSLPDWVPGTLLSVRLLTQGANGNVVADAVFDPPVGEVSRSVPGPADDLRARASDAVFALPLQDLSAASGANPILLPVTGTPTAAHTLRDRTDAVFAQLPVTAHSALGFSDDDRAHATGTPHDGADDSQPEGRLNDWTSPLPGV